MASFTLTADTPTEVVRTSDSTTYLYFPQAMSSFGDGPGAVPFLHTQADSDSLHPDGWSGRHFASLDGSFSEMEFAHLKDEAGAGEL